MNSHQIIRTIQSVIVLWILIATLLAAIILLSWLLEAETSLLITAILGFGLGVWGAIVTRRMAQEAQTTLDSTTQEIGQLRRAVERSQIISQMATTLSSTLKYDNVLEVLLNLGNLALHNPSPEHRLVSAAFVFHGEDDKLHVTSSQRFTLADQKKSTDGQHGILGRAINEGEPVFGTNANNDPELRYYVSFNGMQSLLAIPLKAGYQNYGVLVFGSPETQAFDDKTVDVLTTISTQATIALQNAVLYHSILGEKERIVQVEEDARKKLARDLHDGPTQTISVILMRVGIIQTLIKEKNTKKAIRELGKIGELADKTTKEIRQLLFNLRPLVLENQGLVAALKEMSRKMKYTYDLEVVVQAQSNIDQLLEDKAQGALFYVVEEAVNNARKHAQAAQIQVRLHRRGEHCIVEIEDNGVGFDVQDVNTDYHKRGSLGMVNMRERAELVDGEITIQSTKGEGTKISVRIPIPKDMLPESIKLLDKAQQSRQNVSLAATRFKPQLSAHDADEEVPGWTDLLDSQK